MPRAMIVAAPAGVIITGSVNSSKGTFAHGLYTKPQNMNISIIGATGTAAQILYDYDNSDKTSVILVGNDANYLNFRATFQV